MTTQLILDDPYIEPPTPAQWQQMRKYHEDWLEEVRRNPDAHVEFAQTPWHEGSIFDKKPGI